MKLFAEVLPKLSDALERILREENQPNIAAQIKRISIYEKDITGNNEWWGVYTQPRPHGSYGPNHETIPLLFDGEMVNIDVVTGNIAYIEIAGRKDLKETIQNEIQ